MSETENQLVEYIKTKYDPVAIVLHGSRANGMARQYSDWDVVILVNQDKEPTTREIVFGANLELKQIVLPAENFIGFFFRSENTKILLDTDSTAKKLIEEMKKRLKKVMDLKRVIGLDVEHSYYQL